MKVTFKNILTKLSGWSAAGLVCMICLDLLQHSGILGYEKYETISELRTIRAHKVTDCRAEGFP
jgi:hypothetical protein